MSLSRHTVLATTVDIYRKSGAPVSAETLADSLDATEPALSEPLVTLCEADLLEATERGYRPTVTAHELLAEGIQLDDVLVLEVVDE